MRVFHNDVQMQLTCSLARLACGILLARKASRRCFAGASAAATRKRSAACCRRTHQMDIIYHFAKAPQWCPAAPSETSFYK